MIPSAMRYPTRRRLWGLVLSLVTAACASAATAGEKVKVTTGDGRVIFGELLAPRAGKTVVVRSGVRDIHLASRTISAIDRVAAIPAASSYTIKANAALVKSTRKKGTIGPVVTEFVIGPMDSTGKCSVSLRDPKLGEVSFTAVVSRITPQTYFLDGVEYRQSLGFPCSFPNRFWKRIVLGQVDLEKPESLARAIAFFIEAGDGVTAGTLIDALGRISPDAANEQRVAVEVDAIRRALRKADRLELQGEGRKAAGLVGALEMSRRAAGAAPDLEAKLDATVARFAELLDIMARAETALASAGVTGAKPSAAQARRVVKAARMGVEGQEALTKADMAIVLAPWSGPLFDKARPAPELLEHAAGLAGATATFFAAARPGTTRELAQRFAESPLSMPAKLAIFSYARTVVPRSAAGRGRITYTHRETREQYHYFLTLPPNYDPRRPTPAIVCMHGQNSKAGVMGRFWGRTAAANGMILIDPEYIYGRTHGYRFSSQAHHAVIGALSDAAGRCNIDTDRVYLTGHSQGGHACWDMGGAHAGRFAGVLPVIGAPILASMLPNYMDTALYSIDGSADGRAPGMNREALKKLAGLGCDATYVEYIGRGHEGFTEEQDQASLWMMRHRRDPAPERLHLVALRNCDTRRRWIEIRSTVRALNPLTASGKFRMSPEPVTAMVLASVHRNTFAIRTTNVSRLRLLLRAGLADFSRPITVQLNGRTERPRTLRPDWKFALSDSLARRDRQDIHLGEILLYVRSR